MFDENQNIFYFTRQDTLFLQFLYTLFHYIQRVQFYSFNFFYNTIYIITLYDNRNIYTPHVDQFLFSLLCVYFYSKIFQHIKYLKKQFKIVQSSSEYIPLINIIPCVTPAPKVHLKSLSLSTGL